MVRFFGSSIPALKMTTISWAGGCILAYSAFSLTRVIREIRGCSSFLSLVAQTCTTFLRFSASTGWDQVTPPKPDILT